MPLVTRSSSQSTVYAQATAPTISEDGETWVDTDTGAVYTSENGAWISQSVGAIGTARQQLAVNSNADGLEYVSSPHSLMTAQGDILYASAANTPARLAKGTALHGLRMNSGATAPEWAALASTIEYIDSYVAGSAEATKTFTFATPINFANYSKIIIQCDGGVTAALGLLLRLNGLTDAQYDSQGHREALGVIIAIVSSAATSIPIMSNASLSAANYGFSGFCEITRELITTTRPNVFSKFTGADTLDTQRLSSRHRDNITTLTSVTILTSTSTWLTGTTFTVYGVKRS